MQIKTPLPAEEEFSLYLIIFHMTSCETLFGPYGSELDKLVVSKKLSDEDSQDPSLIVESEDLQNATTGIARSYLYAGANHPTTNTFWAREILEADSDLYQAVIEQHLSLVWRQVQSLGLPGKSLRVMVSLGPKGKRCYEPATAPEADESEAFHGKQLDLLLQAADAVGVPFIPLF